MSGRRPSIRVPAALLLGILTTLAIAWPMPVAMLRFGFITHAYGARWPCETPIGPATFTQSRHVLSDAFSVRMNRLEDSFINRDKPQPLPYWVALPRESDPQLYFIDTGAAGWPFRAFASESWQRRTLAPAPAWQETLRYNVLLATTARGRVFLPIRPIWLGLIGDLLVFSLAWWTLLALGSKARRSLRRRRGLCPACAYDLRATLAGSPCPECGSTLAVATTGGEQRLSGNPSLPPS